MHLSFRTISLALFALSALSTPIQVLAAESSPQSVPAEASPVLSTAAIVNGVKITSLDLKRALKVLMQGQRGAKPNDEKLKEMEKQALNQLISAEILYQAGQKIEIKDIDKQVEEKLKTGRAKFKSESDFTKAIKELEMGETDLKEYTRKDMVISNFVEKTIIPKILVTENDARTFYEQNPDKFIRPESFRASHILIGTDGKVNDSDKKLAYDKAAKLRKELASGADFAALAKDNSTCPSKVQGGDLGYFVKGQMVPAFEKAAFDLKPGEISDVVETQFGYHIIKLMEKKAASKVDFKEAKPRIEDFLKNQKIGAAVGQFLEESRKTANIEILHK